MRNRHCRSSGNRRHSLHRARRSIRPLSSSRPKRCTRTGDRGVNLGYEQTSCSVVRARRTICIQFACISIILVHGSASCPWVFCGTSMRRPSNAKFRILGCFPASLHRGGIFRGDTCICCGYRAPTCGCACSLTGCAKSAQKGGERGRQGRHKGS